MLSQIHCNLSVVESKFPRISFLISLFARTYMTEEVDDEGRFKYYFMALTASIDA